MTGRFLAQAAVWVTADLALWRWPWDPGFVLVLGVALSAPSFLAAPSVLTPHSTPSHPMPMTLSLPTGTLGATRQ